MNPRTVLGAVLAAALLVNAAIGLTGNAPALLELHGAMGVIAFVAAVAYAYTGRKFRPALALGALLSVLLVLQGYLGLTMLLSGVKDSFATFHTLTGATSLLIGIVGGILVGRAERRAEGR